MKKKWLVWVVAAAMTLGLAACGGVASSGSSQSASSSAAEETKEEETKEETKEEETETASETSEQSAAEEQQTEETTSESEAGGEEEPMVGMANPWTETTNLEEAIQGSGINFEPPVAGLEGFDFLQYLYAENMIDALFSGDAGSMTVRVGRDVPQEVVSGDYNEYSKTWEESLKGLTVTCKGDGEKINVATFGVDNISFAILVNSGEEGNGITIDEVNSLVNGMQASAL